MSLVRGEGLGRVLGRELAERMSRVHGWQCFSLVSVPDLTKLAGVRLVFQSGVIEPLQHSKRDSHGLCRSAEQTAVRLRGHDVRPPSDTGLRDLVVRVIGREDNGHAPAPEGGDGVKVRR